MHGQQNIKKKSKACSSSPRLGLLTLEDGTDTFSRKVGTTAHFDAA